MDGGELGWFKSVGELGAVEVCFGPGFIKWKIPVAVTPKLGPEEGTEDLGGRVWQL